VPIGVGRLGTIDKPVTAYAIMLGTGWGKTEALAIADLRRKAKAAIKEAKR